MQDLDTVRDILEWVRRRFEKADLYFGHGTDNAWDEAVWLVLHILQLPYDIDQKILNQSLTAKQREDIINLAKRRIAERIPIAYLINEAWFAGIPFYVDNRVIIPRSPIAELITNKFQPWLGGKVVKRILDIGTGSGCIAIASALAFPDAMVDAVDVSSDALTVARINVVKHKVAERVRLQLSDVFSALDDKIYDVIISNPPYIKTDKIALFPKEYKHEPELALNGGENDGLLVVDKILHQAKAHLNEDGLLIVEVGDNVDYLMRQYPKIAFIWPEFINGGEGVFILNKCDILDNLLD